MSCFFRRILRPSSQKRAVMNCTSVASSRHFVTTTIFLRTNISLYPARRSLDSLEMGIWIMTRWSKGKWKLDGRSIPQELYGITSFVFMIALSTLCHKPDLYLLWMLAFILSSSTLYREWSAQGLSPRRDQWHLCKDLTLIFLSRQHQSNSHVRSILWVDFASIAMKVSSKTQKATLVCGITLPYDRM